MPRYIDAERLSREVISSWDNDKHATLEASRVHRQEHHHLMRIIEKQPTADVVPRSEIVKILDELKEYIPPQKIGLFNSIYIDDVIYELKKKYTEGK